MPNKSGRKKGDLAPDLLRKLVKQGYRFRKPGEFVKFTHWVNENTLLRFKQTAAELNYKLQDASTDAFELWLLDKEPELEALAEARKKSGKPHKPNPVEPDPDDTDAFED